jgi:uncharacterized peroxidase-related enzyme
VAHHAAGLARLTRRTHDADFARRIATDYASAPLSDRERALLDYAAKLTRTPGRMVESDLAPLRAAGLSDGDILDAALVVGYFAYVNRIADGLGVQLDDYVKKPTTA